MISVRPFEEKDKEAVRRICIETSSFPLSRKGMHDYLLLMYNDYYTENDQDVCFVCTNENDEAIGYLLCAKDYKRYRKIFMKNYLPRIARLGLSYFVMAFGELMIYRRYAEKYPAHLHIDLSEGCRRRGVGSEMMNELKRTLCEKGIHSLMLSCGSQNTPAIKFYQKNSFEIICSTPGSKIMACNF